MRIKTWLDPFLDSTVVFSFDRSGFKRHCPLPLECVDLSGRLGFVSGASSGIGLELKKELLAQGMECLLTGRDLEKLKKKRSS